jgi:hypothetical protein
MSGWLRERFKRLRYALSPHLAEYFELGRYARQWVAPREPAAGAGSCLIPRRRLDAAGLALNEARQLEWLKRWQREHAGHYELLRADPAINTQHCGEGCLHNGYYPTPDAEVYASMILDARPGSIVEVGGGFSTLIARKTVAAAGLQCPITVIDPCPRTDVRAAADTVILAAVEDLPAASLGIRGDTLLFIDSSHICRPGGDLAHLYCTILPTLPAGVIVHVHDVFLPYDYPPVYQQWLYGEQYLLHGILSHSRRYEVLFTTHYLTRSHPREMQETFGAIVGADERFFGASLWFAVR